MSLPSPPLGDRITKGRQARFDGLDHNLGAGDGAIWDMRNLTGDLFPLLATREKRRLARTLSTPNGLAAWDGLVWVDGDGLYYKGERKGTVANSRKRFAALGAYLVILPDKKYLNTLTGEFGSMESRWSGSSLTFTNGKLFEEEAEANCVQAAGVSWGSFFKAGDAVTISGCTKHTANNKTPVIREIDGDKLYFYENVFTLDGEEGTTPYTETGTLKLERTVPDLEFLLENENRLWGCAGDTIYASKLGDIFNWNVYEGLDTDSYAVDTGSAGPFTGCVSFLGYPVFFKEDRIFKVYGSRPENYLWDVDKQMWTNIGSMQGPPGPQGPAGQDGAQGPAGPAGADGQDGAQGTQGEPGADGTTYTPAVSADGTLSWTNDSGKPNPDPVNIKGPAGKDGADGAQGIQGPPGEDGTNGQDGENGATFTPSVSESGVLSWANDKGLPNPASVDIKGPAGAAGQDGAPGLDGADGAPGADGKSAYQYAVDGGYTGTEEEFQALMGTGPWLPLAGGTMTGALNVQAPTAEANPATKSYVDGLVGGIAAILDSINGEVA